MQGKNARVHCTQKRPVMRRLSCSMIHRPCLTLRRLALASPARQESKKWAAAHFQIHFFHHHHHHFHHFTTLQQHAALLQPHTQEFQKEVKPLFSFPQLFTQCENTSAMSEKVIHKTAAQEWNYDTLRQNKNLCCDAGYILQVGKAKLKYGILANAKIFFWTNVF